MHCLSRLALCRFQQPEWSAAQGNWAATVLQGHLNFHNFHTTSAPTTETAAASHGLHADDLGSAADASHVQDEALSPPSNTVAAMLQNHSSQAAARTRLEAERMPAGNSLKSCAGDVWSGNALNCSVKQAIADQPSSSSAQLIELDCAPAEYGPGRRAQQEPALAVTATTPPAALPSTPALAQAALQMASSEAATVCTSVHANKTCAVGAKQQSHGRGQHASSPSNAAATQGTAVGGGAGGAAAGVGNVAAAVGAAEARAEGTAGARGTAVARGAAVGAGGAAQRGPDEAEADFQAVAAQARGDAATDRGSNHDCTAGRGVCRGSHLQGGHPARHLEIKLVPAGPELVELEYPLYYKYQTCNHHDEPGKVCWQIDDVAPV